ncbi:MAG: hypothetical protein WBO44_14130, partial [Saprospiraceae bacterium]
MFQENMPQIEIRTDQEYYNYNNNLVWSVYNRGGNLINFSLDEVSFIEVLNSNGERIMYIPIYGYINKKGKLSGATNGLIYQFDNNSMKLTEIKLMRSLDFNNYTMQIISFVAIYYEDIFNAKHSEYYAIYPGIYKYNQNVWDKFYSKYM